MIDILIAIFYQPFFNALIFFYGVQEWMFSNADMGVAVILFTLTLRLAMLPLTLKSNESAEERKRISDEYNELKDRYKDSSPIIFKKEKASLVRKNSSAVRFEAINLAITMLIALILWRVFGEGLKGADLGLIYGFMPEIDQPFNLIAFGGLDLTQTNFTYSIIGVAALFVVETLHIMFQPLPATANDRLMQFLLPAIVFFYFIRMPVGKVLFIVMTLAFSISVMMIREVKNTIDAIDPNK